MHPALMTLTRLRIRATLRRMTRTMKSGPGIVFSILGALLLLLWLGPAVFSVASRRPEIQDPQALLLFGPVALAAICIANTFVRLGRGALYFSPAEIDFLFAAPVSRVHLLVYKLWGVVAASVGVGIFFGIFMGHLAQWLVASIVGASLAMLFANLASVALAMLKELAFERGAYLARFVAISLIAAALFALVLPFVTLAPGLNLIEAARSVVGHPSVRFALAPLHPFVHAFAADNATDLVAWSSAAILVIVALVLVIIRLDQRTIEASFFSSQKAHQRLEQVSRGNALTTWKGAARYRLMPLPRLGGAGPIIWRQMTTAMRNSRSLLMFLLMMLSLLVVVQFVFRGSEGGGGGPVVLIGPALFFTLFLITMMRFDFRGDLDQIDWLKMLPVRANALVIGELFTPIVLLCAIQWFVLGVFAIVYGHGDIVLIACAFAVPLNVVLIGMENIMFLLYPTRQHGAGLGDLQAVGRNVVLFLARGTVLGLWVGIAAAIGFLAMMIASGSVAALLITAWLVMMFSSVAVIPATVAAYRRFDVSMHTPA